MALLQERLGISQKAAGKLCLAANRLLMSSFETLDAKMDWLQERLNLTEVELSKVIKGHPRILTLSKNKILEVQQWMSERLHLSDARIVQTCRNKPEVLASKVSTLEEKVNWVQAAMSLSDEELSDLFGKSLFQCSSEKNLEPKLRFLQKTFDLSDQGLKILVTKQPTLITKSEKDIEEKVKFYSQLVGESEAKRLVTKSSNLLVRSLKNRLKPRLAQVQSTGNKVVWTEKLIQRLARRSDDQWERYGLGEVQRRRKRPSD